MKKVSIIIPLFNTENYIEDALKSCISQTYSKYEIIVVNDGSTDSSLERVEDFAAAHKEKDIHIISIENSGLSIARNEGLKYASGEYICFLDSDDMLYPNSLETCVVQMEIDNLDMVTFDSFTFCDDGYDECENLLKDSINYDTMPHRRLLSGVEFANAERMSGGVFVTAWQSFYRRRFIEKNNIRFLPGAVYEDNAFHFECLYYAERVMYLPEILIKHRIRKGSIIQSKLSLQKIRSVFEISNYILEVLNRDIEKKQITADLFGYAYGKISGLIGMIAEQLYGENYRLLQDNANLVSYNATKIINTFLEVYSKSARDDAAIQSSLDLLYVVVDGFDFYSTEMRTVCQNIKNQYICNRLKAIDVFYRPHLKLGLYGCGNIARFLFEYIEILRKRDSDFFKNEYVFVDSKSISHEKTFLGRDVINVKDVAREKIDAVVILSDVYSNVMKEYLKAFAPNVPVYIPDGICSYTANEMGKLRYTIPNWGRVPLDGQGGYEKWMTKRFESYPTKPTSKRRIFLLNTPFHDNVGDYLITHAEKRFFEKYYPEYELIEINENRLFDEKDLIFDQIRILDLVVITGGGFIGIWDSRQNIENVLSHCKRNEIIIFPHSAYFGEHDSLERLQKMNLLLSKCQSVTFIARERHTYDFINKFLPASVKKELMPDIALTLKSFKFEKERNGAAVFLRTDKESILSVGDRDFAEKLLRKHMKIVFVGSMHQGKIISELEEESSVYEKLSEIAGYELVVTDMLHCVISCALTGTPCIAVNNATRKVEGVYEWIRELPYICFTNSSLEMLEMLCEWKWDFAGEHAFDIDIDKYVNKLCQIIDKGWIDYDKE